MEFLFYGLIGLVSAIFGSIVGLGGGIIIVPALVYFGPSLLGMTVPETTAVGTSLAVLIFTALSSTLTFQRQKRIDFKTGLLLFITCGPGAIAGSYTTRLLNPDTFRLSFGFFMLAMALLLVARDYLKPLSINWRIQRTYTDRGGSTFEYGYSPLPLLLIGFLVGGISGLFGIGGGSLFVPAMILLFRFPPHIATATSMFVVFLASITGSVTHFALGEVNLTMLLGLAPTALIGGVIGAKITQKMSSTALLWVLRVSFVLIAVKMIAEGFMG